MSLALAASLQTLETFSVGREGWRMTRVSKARIRACYHFACRGTCQHHMKKQLHTAYCMMHIFSVLPIVDALRNVAAIIRQFCAPSFHILDGHLPYPASTVKPEVFSGCSLDMK